MNGGRFLKEQLGEEAIRRSGALYELLIDAVFDPAPDVVTGVSDFFGGAAEHLEATGYEDACPIATVALEVASTNETLRRATAEVFESWTANAARRLHEAGIAKAKARQVATLLLTMLEGAFILSRTARSVEPLLLAKSQAVSLVSDSISEVQGKASSRRRRDRR